MTIDRREQIEVAADAALRACGGGGFEPCLLWAIAGEVSRELGFQRAPEILEVLKASPRFVCENEGRPGDRRFRIRLAKGGDR